MEMEMCPFYLSSVQVHGMCECLSEEMTNSGPEARCRASRGPCLLSVARQQSMS